MNAQDAITLSEIKAMQLAARLQSIKKDPLSCERKPMAVWDKEDNESGALLGFLMAGISGFFIGGALVFMLMK